MKRLLIVAVATFFSLPLASQTGSTPPGNPKVRAITGFVRLDRSTWEKQIGEALVVLRKAQRANSQARATTSNRSGIVTQPIGELVAGCFSEDEAVALLGRLDALSAKENFLPNVGPAMMHDTDNPAPMKVLERALSTLPNIEASTIIADDAGIHWKTIRRTAELVKYVAEHSARAQGTFNLTATAMLKPLWAVLSGCIPHRRRLTRQFAIGFEGAGAGGGCICARQR